MTPTAPSLNHLMHRKIYLESKIKYRRAATYFQAPLKDVKELERVENLIKLHHSSKEAVIPTHA